MAITSRGWGFTRPLNVRRRPKTLRWACRSGVPGAQSIVTKDAHWSGSGESSLQSGWFKMRNSLLLGVLVLFALATFAQQSNNSSSNDSANAGATQRTSEREPLTSPRPNDFWDGDDPNLANLITHPFASKKYVQRKVTPTRDRISELEQLTAENSRLINDVDTRAQQGVQLASEKSSLADQHASDAANKAQVAQTAANEASSRVSKAEQMIGGLDRYKGSAQTEIRFRPGQAALSKPAKDALDDMASPLKDQQGYIIEVRGFAPGHGQTAISNSQKMADSVVRYFVLTHHVPVYRIHTVSMGNVAGSDGKRGSAARVEITVLRNDLDTSAER